MLFFQFRAAPPHVSARSCVRRVDPTSAFLSSIMSREGSIPRAAPKLANPKAVALYIERVVRADCADAPPPRGCAGRFGAPGDSGIIFVPKRPANPCRSRRNFFLYFRTIRQSGSTNRPHETADLGAPQV